jgi:hypothetical protein
MSSKSNGIDIGYYLSEIERAKPGDPKFFNELIKLSKQLAGN